MKSAQNVANVNNGRVSDMIAAIVPQFFSTDIKKTLTYFDSQLGFETQFEYGDPTFYAGAIRDGQSMFFRHTDVVPPTSSDKYENELLDAYLRVEGVNQLWEEFGSRKVEFHRELAEMPWGFTEFVVKDIDGRLLCFGQALESGS